MYGTSQEVNSAFSSSAGLVYFDLAVQSLSCGLTSPCFWVMPFCFGAAFYPLLVRRRDYVDYVDERKRLKTAGSAMM